MRFLVAVLMMTGAYAGTAMASELDRERSVVNADRELEGTTVLRVNRKTGEVAYLKTSKVADDKAEAKALTRKSFKKVPASRNVSELDADGGASSWYFCYQPSYNYYNYSYNSYYYYGRYYSPYYTYKYKDYDYYYYGSQRRNRCDRYDYCDDHDDYDRDYDRDRRRRRDRRDYDRGYDRDRRGYDYEDDYGDYDKDWK